MPDREFPLAEVSARLADSTADLRRQFMDGNNGFFLAAQRTAAVDAVVQQLFGCLVPARQRDQIAVLAIGGYGRRHLAPCSDIDLMFLHLPDTEVDSTLARFGRVLWDVGLKPTNICSSIAELTVHLGDMQTLTACLDARRVTGSLTVFGHFERLLAEHLDRVRVSVARQLIRELDMDCVAALRELNRSEPELKHAPFLLRDTQRIYWVSSLLAPPAAVRGFGHSTFLKPDDVERLNQACEFFLRVRTALHFLAHRKEDAILVQYQPELARDLGFKPEGHLRAEECFLRDLYVRTRAVYLASRQIAELAETDPRLEPTGRRKAGRVFLSPGFVRVGRYLHLSESAADWWGRAPALHRLLEPFLLLEQTRLTMPYAMLNALRQAAESCPAPDPVTLARSGTVFRQMLGAHQPVGPLLAQMHFSGVLALVLPEFGALTCAAQFNPVHQYTVDAHSLLAVTELDQFLGGASSREVESYRIVFGSIQDVAALRLAALLHDCGKGYEGDHAAIGAPLAAAAARRLGFGPEAVAEVECLVREHLLLSRACQQRDIEDAALLSLLAGKAGTRRRLNMLLLLTFADMRCVREGIWTGWRAEQLWVLYHRLARFLEQAGTGETDFERELALYRPATDSPVTREVLEQHVAQMAWTEYVEHVPFERIVEHAGAALRHTRGSVEILFCQQPHVTRIMVVADDRRGFFSHLVGTLTASHLQIVQGWCFTRRDGVVVDEMEVQDAFSSRHVAEAAWAEVETTLRRVLLGDARIEEIMARHRRTFPTVVPPSPRAAIQARLDNHSSQHYTIIDLRAGDRAGLLFDLGSALERFGADLRFVKISTHSGQAADSFYLVSGRGTKLPPDEATQLLLTMEKAAAPRKR